MSKERDWEKVADEIVYPGYQTIRQKTFITPDGSKFTYDIGFLQHEICTVALTAANQFIVVEQFRPGPETYIMELPAGGLDKDEEPMTAAARELLEETGYQGEMEPLHESFFSAYSPRIRYNFLARNCRKIAEPQPGPGEFIKVKLLSVPEFFEYIVNGGSTDVEAGFSALYRLGFLKKNLPE